MSFGSWPHVPHFSRCLLCDHGGRRTPFSSFSSASRAATPASPAPITTSSGAVPDVHRRRDARMHGGSWGSGLAPPEKHLAPRKMHRAPFACFCVPCKQGLTVPARRRRPPPKSVGPHVTMDQRKLGFSILMINCNRFFGGFDDVNRGKRRLWQTTRAQGLQPMGGTPEERKGPLAPTQSTRSSSAASATSPSFSGVKLSRTA